jgi:hypothetical protein
MGALDLATEAVLLDLALAYHLAGDVGAAVSAAGRRHDEQLAGARQRR